MRDFDDEFGYFEVTTVGMNTYGKGIMQSTFSLSDGSTLTLTVAYYNPPSGVNYDGVGIAPDVTVEASDSGDAQLDAAYTEIYKIIK
jgi:carboxyl-terminal processing protease